MKETKECMFKKCDGSGRIWLENQMVERCKCAIVNDALVLYRFSRGDETLFKFPVNLKEEQNIKTESGKLMPYNALLADLTDENMFDKAIAAKVHLFLVGGVGTGKSQFASTMLLMYIWRHEQEGLYIDVRKFKDYIFDKEEKRKIREKLEFAKVVVIDDIGAESTVQNGAIQYIVEELDYIARNHKGLLIITSNKYPDKLGDLYKDDKGNPISEATRMISALVTGNSKMYNFGNKSIRAKQKSSVIDLLP